MLGKICKDGSFTLLFLCHFPDLKERGGEREGEQSAFLCTKLQKQFTLTIYTGQPFTLDNPVRSSLIDSHLFILLNGSF